MKREIKLIEDQPEQMKTIKEALEARYRDVDVQTFETERSFRDYLKDVDVEHAALPEVVISDVMFRWDFPEPDAPAPPPDVESGTFREAGIRCWKQARKMGLKNVPWVYFTVLDADTTRNPANWDGLTRHVQKSGSFVPLFAELDDLFELSKEWSETGQEVTDALLNNPKTRAGLLEGIAAPLESCAASLSQP